MSLVLKSRVRIAINMVAMSAFFVGSLSAFSIAYSVGNHTVEAAVPPDSCFAFSAGVITDYYNNENNNSEQPACTKNVTIPSQIGGVAVITIGASSFIGSDIVSLILPESVQNIGTAAFQFSQINSLILPDSLTSLGEEAFMGSYNLTSLHIGPGLTSLPDRAFQGTALETLYIPSTITSFEQSTFQGLPLKTLVIGEANYSGPSTLDIPGSAFQGQDISSLQLHSNVRSIGDYAFAYNDLSGTLSYPDTIPATLVSLGYAAFQGNSYTIVVLPDIQTMGDVPFNLNSLESVTIGTANYSGPALLEVPQLTPSLYGNISELHLGRIVRSIGDDAFTSQPLTSVTFPDGLESIGEDAFGNTRLTSIVIPNSVKTIKRSAFAGNFNWSDPKSLTVRIGSGIETIEDSAFGSNPTLDEVYIAGNPVLDSSAFRFSGGLCGGTELAKCYVRIYATHPNFVAAYGPGRRDASVGYIINPATYTINYRSSTGTTLAPSFTSAVGSTLADYSFAANEAGDFSLYYRSGDTIPLIAPAIDSYVTPAAHTMALVPGSNTYTFTYATPSADIEDEEAVSIDTSTDDSNSSLSETGASQLFSIGMSTLLLGCAFVVIYRAARP